MQSAAQTMSFMQQQATDVDAKSVVTDLQVTEETATLRRRVHSVGHRHGKAFGNVGVVTVAYSQGFAQGFMSAFTKD